LLYIEFQRDDKFSISLLNPSIQQPKNNNNLCTYIIVVSRSLCLINCSTILKIRGQFYQRSTYSFYARRSRKRKKDRLFLHFLGSAHAKAVCRMLIKLTPVVNFINVKRTYFSYERHVSEMDVRTKNARV